MTLDIIQTADHQMTKGQTVIWQDDPFIVRSVEPRPRCTWGVGYLNNASQPVLYPIEVVVVLERFDGYDSPRAA